VPIKPAERIPINPTEYKRRYTIEVAGIGGSNAPVVISDFSSKKITQHKDLADIGYKYDEKTDKWSLEDMAADIFYLGKNDISFNLPENIKLVLDYREWLNVKSKKMRYPLLSSQQFLNNNVYSEQLNFVKTKINDFDSELINKLKEKPNVVLVIETNNEHGMAEQRRLFFELIENEIDYPVIVKREYKNISSDELRLYASTDLGALLIDGFGDGVWIISDDSNKPKDISDYSTRFVTVESKEKFINRTLFGILQAARVRISKTEYIACPSCGRTLFDLQETTDMIKKRTEHLKGIKIAVMGCIVNGPGEMADADYGYVGSGVDKITLYRNKDVVKRSVPAEDAVDELIELIKEDGNWVNKS
jgi:(E)-4-hydroxy-3-methylbut-2-enyl-diphosphate synthase